MRNNHKAIAILVILLCAATAEARGWRGIVPLHSTRSQVEQLLGPPNEQNGPHSVVYKTPNETVLIDYSNGLPCGIGEKYGRWRVAPNTVIDIFINPHPGSPLSQLSIDEARYKKFIVGHLSETRYVNSREGEALTVVGNEVRSIDYFAAADDSHLECPGLPKADLTNCEYIIDPFDSLGEMGFEQEDLFLDNFFIALSNKKSMAYIIAYGGRRARPNEAQKRADRAKQYLTTIRHFPADRIKVIDGGYREKRDLVLYVVSEAVCRPTPQPTVDPRDVEILRHRRVKGR
jgi:hypothetical protein